MEKEVKKKLVLSLKRETGWSISKCQKELEKSGWNISALVASSEPLIPETPLVHPEKKAPVDNKTIKKQKRKAPKASEKIESAKASHAEASQKEQAANDVHKDFKAYIQNCEKFHKHPELVPDCIQIGPGFYTMDEINAYTKKIALPPSEKADIAALESFNKRHKTSYSSWKEASCMHAFTEDELLRHKDCIHWYSIAKSNKVSAELAKTLYSNKKYKELKEKIMSLNVLTQLHRIP